MKTRIYPKNESEGKDKNLFEAQLAGRNERETRSQFTHTINKKKILNARNNSAKILLIFASEG